MPEHDTTEAAREAAEQLDVDAPNESAPGHNPDDAASEEETDD